MVDRHYVRHVVMQLLVGSATLRGIGCAGNRAYAVPVEHKWSSFADPHAECERVCQAYVQKWDGCSVATAYAGCDYVSPASFLGDDGGAQDAQEIKGYVICTLKMDPRRCPAGRLPSEMAAAMSGSSEPSEPSHAGEHFFEMAHLEAAAVVAFRELALELEVHGAPSDLVSRARQAAREERDHARRAATLALRYHGADPQIHTEMMDTSRGPKAPIRPLREVAELNASEGCVHETFAAYLAGYASADARGPLVRTLLRGIAGDEFEHALLAWDVHTWLMSILGPRERRRVSQKMEEAAVALRSDVEGRRDVPWSSEVGLAPVDARARAARGLSSLWLA